jgi:ribosomal-protein-alanine N-acetyltransferase
MIHSDIALRLATQADASAISGMSRVLIEYGLKWRWTTERVAASIEDPAVNVLVARADSRLVGFAIMRYGDDSAHLDLLAVAPAYRRSGIARRLLGWLEKCAVVAGIFQVALEVREGNEAAQLFYERAGYRPITHLPGYYQGVEAAIRMGRDLSFKRPDREDMPRRP